MVPVYTEVAEVLLGNPGVQPGAMAQRQAVAAVEQTHMEQVV
jgi:hypothetical protein